MKITVGRLRQLIREGKISASADYMKKEKVREELQGLVAVRVASGEIADQAALEQFIKDIGASVTSLKMIPFDVWKKLGSQTR